MFDSLPHLIPEEDHFLHDTSPGCPCHPVVESRFAPSFGGAAWYRHQLIQPEPVADVFPAGWASS